MLKLYIFFYPTQTEQSPSSLSGAGIYLIGPIINPNGWPKIISMTPIINQIYFFFGQLIRSNYQTIIFHY